MPRAAIRTARERRRVPNRGIHWSKTNMAHATGTRTLNETRPMMVNKYFSNVMTAMIIAKSALKSASCSEMAVPASSGISDTANEAAAEAPTRPVTLALFSSRVAMEAAWVSGDDMKSAMNVKEHNAMDIATIVQDTLRTRLLFNAFFLSAMSQLSPIFDSAKALSISNIALHPKLSQTSDKARWHRRPSLIGQS